MATRMIEVTVRVPEDGVPAFYVMHGEWLREWETRQGGSHVPVDWTKNDRAVAALVWEKLPARSKTLVDLLITRGEMTPSSLVTALGLKDFGQLTGVNGWVGRRANEFGRTTPIKPKLMRGETMWTVDPMVAELLRQARG